MRKKYLHNSYGEKDVFWDLNWDGDWEQKSAQPPTVFLKLAVKMLEYLKPGMLLLEGGCGDGRYVRYFAGKGIKSIGIDFAQSTVQNVKKNIPNIDVRVGDIRSLEFPNECFDAYYSGGVIEHLEDGLGPQLAEAHRVLKKGGYFFVTVPHMNFSRKCAAAFMPTRTKIDMDGRRSFHKERINSFRVETPPEGYHFHEYVLETSEMRKFLTMYGFDVVEEMCFSSDHGLLDIEFYRRLVGVGLKNRTIANKIFSVPLRLVRVVEDRTSFLCNVVSDAFGAVFGNLKLYVCRARNERSE